MGIHIAVHVLVDVMNRLFCVVLGRNGMYRPGKVPDRVPDVKTGYLSQAECVTGKHTT